MDSSTYNFCNGIINSICVNGWKLGNVGIWKVKKLHNILTDYQMYIQHTYYMVHTYQNLILLSI